MLLILGCSAYAQDLPQPPVEVTKQNLFKNPDFENGTTDWKLSSWGKKGTSVIDLKEGIDGKPSLRIVNAERDHTLVNQKVTVKPHTRYRLSGYIKTKDVEPPMPGVKEGAELMVSGGWKRTPPVSLTTPWGYHIHNFTTGNETEIVVGMSLGHYGAKVSGTAWSW